MVESYLISKEPDHLGLDTIGSPVHVRKQMAHVEALHLRVPQYIQ